MVEETTESREDMTSGFLVWGDSGQAYSSVSPHAYLQYAESV